MAKRKYTRVVPLRPMMERIMDKVSPEPNSGCWLWTAYCNAKGYACIGMREGVDVWPCRLAYKVLYEMIFGKVPDGLELDHKCRVRCCVNPQHLEPVTRAENARRGIGPPRWKAWAKQRAKTHCPRGHAYSAENTVVYDGKRGCRTCAHDKSAARAARMKETRHLAAALQTK